VNEFKPSVPVERVQVFPVSTPETK
jgi:hypothetical protein